MKRHQPGGRRSYERFCPLSLALDQVGERWTLHIILALMSGPKRYTQLKTFLAGSGQNILSERLRLLAANGIVARSAGDSPCRRSADSPHLRSLNLPSECLGVSSLTSAG
jgi:DNA-binding HxlR family transcriptional regulator